MDDKRESPRIDVLGALRGDVLVPQPLSITEISRTGMRVETGFPLQLDAVYEFRLTLVRQSLVVKGRVVHGRIGDVDRDVITYISGVEFVGASPQVAAALAEHVDAMVKQRSATP